MFFATHHRVSRCAVIGAFGIVLLADSSCTLSPREQYQERLVSTDKPALHGVHSERLREIGTELRSYIPAQSESALDQEQGMREMQQVAEAMARTAKEIPTALIDVRLPDKDRGLFVNLAEKLQVQALELHQHAKRKNVEEIENSLAKLGATCNACHTSFRVLPIATAIAKAP